MSPEISAQTKSSLTGAPKSVAPPAPIGPRRQDHTLVHRAPDVARLGLLGSLEYRLQSFGPAAVALGDGDVANEEPGLIYSRINNPELQAASSANPPTCDMASLMALARELS